VQRSLCWLYGGNLDTTFSYSCKTQHANRHIALNIAPVLSCCALRCTTLMPSAYQLYCCLTLLCAADVGLLLLLPLLPCAQVHLCGSFTRWVETIPMASVDGTPGVFAVVVHLPPG
jgi:hypothetical protein